MGSVPETRAGESKYDRSPSGLIFASRKKSPLNCPGASGPQDNTLPTNFHIALAHGEVGSGAMRDLRGRARSGALQPPERAPAASNEDKPRQTDVAYSNRFQRKLVQPRLSPNCRAGPRANLGRAVSPALHGTCYARPWPSAGTARRVTPASVGSPWSSSRPPLLSFARPPYFP